MNFKAKTKYWLLLAHRYLGLAGCVMFALWFFSGLVMMYVEMPYLLRTQQRLDGVHALRAPGPLLGPASAVQAAKLQDPPQQLYLNMQDGAPVWRLVPAKGAVVTLDAYTGKRLGPFAPDAGAKVVQAWGGWDGPVVYDRSLAMDQWTVYGSLFDKHRPLHRYRIDGPSGSMVYVSETSGMLVQATTRWERFLGYIGPVVHWVYPTFIRRNVDLWVDLVIAVSAAGTLLAFGGLALGVWNMRHPKSKVGMSPYKKKWLRWHHLFGLVFGVVTLTWIFSGMMSMTPFSWAPSFYPSKDEIAHLRGGDASWSAFRVGPAEALRQVPANFDVKELEAVQFQGRPYWVAFRSPHDSLTLPAWETGSVLPEIPGEQLQAAVQGLVSGADLVAWTRLDDYDNQYYSKKKFKNLKRLPVYRAEFDDEKRQTFYIDPHVGAVVKRTEPLSRLNRILYNGLHSWDFFNFYNKRPWWDFIVGFFMLGGIFLSITSVMIGFNWIRRQKL